MKQNELETLLEELTPTQIVNLHGARLSADNRQYLTDFAQFDQVLSHVQSDYARRLPDPPPMPELNSKKPPKLWFKREIRISLGAAALTAAALILFNFIAIFRQELGMRSTKPPQATIDVLDFYTRGTQDDAALLDLDEPLIEALINRGYFFYEKNHKSDIKTALSHFELAHQIQPRNQRVIKYLILCHEALGNQAAVHKMRSILGELAPAE